MLLFFVRFLDASVTTWSVVNTGNTIYIFFETWVRSQIILLKAKPYRSAIYIERAVEVIGIGELELPW